MRSLYAIAWLTNKNEGERGVCAVLRTTAVVSEKWLSVSRSEGNEKKAKEKKSEEGTT